MIAIENVTIYGLEEAIRGMRNPYNSWDKSDSYKVNMMADDRVEMTDYILGEKDQTLMGQLACAGSDHAKFRRMIAVYADITAPLYWWKEYDTYKVGTVANSCSTMHTITKKEFAAEDFSCEDLMNETDETVGCSPLEFLDVICYALNRYRQLYLETGDKRWWRQIIQTLPSSYNQRRTIMLNYEVLSNIYRARRNHKLSEWQEFCDWIETLPYADGIIFLSEDKRIESLYKKDAEKGGGEGTCCVG